MNEKDEICKALAKLYAILVKHSNPKQLEKFTSKQATTITDLLDSVEKAQAIFCDK